MEWQPHPGFGLLSLTRDGDEPDWWREYSGLRRDVYWIDKGWYWLTRHDGTKVEFFDGDWAIDWLHESVTLGEIEECVAEDPDHDWRIVSEGPLGGVVYQRQGCAQWVAVERLDGFA